MLFMTHYFSLFLVLSSTFIIVSSPSSPLIAWVGLELNSLSFIPLMKNNNNLASHESMIKYFLIQSITSILFLLPTLFLYHFSYNYNSTLNSILFLIMSFSLLTKLAAAPFHFWLFPLINSISWLSFIFLMTWQKIAPLYMLSNFFSNLIIFSIIISTILPPISSINQNSTKMILAYASITHMGWMMTASFTNISLLYFYLLIYMTNFIPIFYHLFYWNLFYLSQILFIPNKHKLFMFFVTLSLSGFPPFMMFMIKIMLTFQFVQNYSLYLITMFLLLSSLLSSYTYIYMNFPLLLKNCCELKNFNFQFSFTIFPQIVWIFLLSIVAMIFMMF